MGIRAVVGALVLASLLAACGARPSAGEFHPHGSASAPDATAPASQGSAPASDPSTAQRSALAAYRGYQLAYEKAYQTNDTRELDAVAMDPLLSQVAEDVSRIRAEGVIWRFHNVLNPRVQGRSKDGSKVVIVDCVHTLGAYRFDAKTGKRLNAWRGGSRFYQAIMRFSGNTWKISEARQGDKC
jgi:hypothetical protein